MAWFGIAPAIWLALSAGWVCVLVSWSIGFEFPSSGAVLVCAAIVAEAYYSRWPYRKIDLVKTYLIVTNRIMDSDSSHLRALANEKETNADGNGDWVAWMTAGRIDRILAKPIIVSAIVGTAIWGYGHLLAPAGNCCH